MYTGATPQPTSVPSQSGPKKDGESFGENGSLIIFYTRTNAAHYNNTITLRGVVRPPRPLCVALARVNVTSRYLLPRDREEDSCSLTLYYIVMIVVVTRRRNKTTRAVGGRDGIARSFPSSAKEKKNAIVTSLNEYTSIRTNAVGRTKSRC